MKCTTIKFGNRSTIACGSRRVDTCRCGQIATRLCDWKTGKDRTCDALMCGDCSTSPAEGKDLCRMHAIEWGARLALNYEERADL